MSTFTQAVTAELVRATLGSVTSRPELEVEPLEAGELLTDEAGQPVAMIIGGELHEVRGDVGTWTRRKPGMTCSDDTCPEAHP